VLLVYAAVGASKVMKSAKAFVLGVMKSAVAVRATHVDLRKQSDRHLDAPFTEPTPARAVAAVLPAEAAPGGPRGRRQA
jgi:hypothetical protein